MEDRIKQDIEVLALLLAITLGPSSHDAIMEYLQSLPKISPFREIIRQWARTHDDSFVNKLLEEALINPSIKIHPSLRTLAERIVNRSIDFRYKSE